MSPLLSNIFRRLGVLAAAVTLFGACITCTAKQYNTVIVKPEPRETIIHGDMMIDPGFSGPEKKLILEALGEWETATNGAVDLDISDNPSREFMEVQAMRKARALMERRKARAAADAGPPAEDDDDDEISEDEIDDGPDGVTDQTINFWDTEQGCTDKMAIVRGTSNNRIIKGAEEAMGTTPGVDSSGLLGLSHPFCRFKYLILVSDRLKSTREFKETIVHELGHMFGMQHTFIKGSGVMYAETEQTVCVTQYDINNFARRWHLDPKTMTPHVCPYRPFDPKEDL